MNKIKLISLLAILATQPFYICSIHRRREMIRMAQEEIHQTIYQTTEILRDARRINERTRLITEGEKP